MTQWIFKNMTIHNFYRQFETLQKEDKFHMIDTPVKPTSLFVIFKQLGEVRAQKRYFEELEAHLLKLAKIGFNQLEDKKNGVQSKTT